MTQDGSVKNTDIKTVLAENSIVELRDLLPNIHPADLADNMARLEESRQSAIFRMLDRDNALEVFEHLDEEEQASLLDALSKEQVAAVVPNLPPDDQADLMTALPDPVAERMLALLPPRARTEVRRLMAYADDSAGALMTTEFATLPPDITVHDAISRLREMAPDKETIHHSYIVDRVGRLIGWASLENLVLAPAGELVRDVMYPDFTSVYVDEDGEDVAKTIEKYDLVAVPVINKDGILVGMVTVDDVLDLIEDEQTEDIYHFGAAGRPVHRYIQHHFIEISRQRVVWLIGLVVAGFISAALVKNFDGYLKETLALAFFIPMLLASCGNAGTQSAAVITRGLATGELTTGDVLRVLRKELSVGLAVGATLGLLTCGLAVLIHQDDMMVGPVVGASMFIAVALATSLGGLLPLLFDRLNLDPALVSSPAIASIVDVTTLCIYFAVAWVMLGH